MVSSGPSGPKRRKAIPKAIKDQVWISHFGPKVAEGACWVCNKTIRNTDFEAGHIIAVAKGGQDTIDNLRPVCSSCNKSMGTTSMDDYKERYFNSPEGEVTKTGIQPVPPQVSSVKPGAIHEPESAGGVQIVDSVEITGTRLPPQPRRTIYVPIPQQSGKSVDVTPDDLELERTEIDILKMLAKFGKPADAVSVAQDLEVHPQRALYHLDNLKEKEYVTYSVAGYDGQRPGYSLTQKGRQYALAREWLPSGPKQSVDLSTRRTNERFNTMYSEGVRLQNEVQFQIRNIEQLRDWVSRSRDWKQQILTGVNPISDKHARRIETLRRFKLRQAPVLAPIDGLVEGIEHQRWANIQSETVSRFEAFLDEHQQ